MKRYLLIALCMMTLVVAACSKSKKEEDATPKTVDLGETSADETPGKTKDNAAKDAPKKSNKNTRRSKNNKTDEISEKEAYRRNEEARLNEDGTAKRGKPAAELEFEEKQAKEKAQKAKDTAPKDDAKKADTEVAEGIDFTDEAVDETPAKKEILPARTPRPKNALSIEKLINIRELREQTGYSGALSEAWLLGQNPDERYNAMRLATDNEKQLGFSVQVWKPGNESAASKRFNDLYQQSFGGKKIKSVATDAFTASHHDINELGFYEKSKRAAVLLSCSSDVCTQEQLKAVALIIQRRL